MFKKKPVLKYESAIETYPNIITPAKNHIPEWYKEIPRWKNNQMFTVENGFGITVKHCMPFLDSLTSGYMVVLPNDIYVKNNNGSPYVSWNNMEFPLKWRDEISDSKLVPAGHYPREYLWQTGTSNTIPLGYSMLFTHPLNRYDLPFTTLSGIIDGGLVMHPTGQIPFYIKEGFEGIIPQGTPYAQIIPFRQENWSSEVSNGLNKKGKEHHLLAGALISGWYKKTFWTRKKYE